MSATWKSIDHVHLTDQVYQALRDRILNRAMQTNEQIQIEEIADKMGISRTPVVEALKRLENDGLVEVKARRGTYVRAITEKDLRETFQIREALELYAGRYVIESPTRSAVAKELWQWYERMAPLAGDGEEYNDYLSFSEADKAFHCTLIQACDNERMLIVYDRLNYYMQIMRGHRFKRLVQPTPIQDDHRAICEAIEEGDFAKLETTIKCHLSSVNERLLENLRSNGGVL